MARVQVYVPDELHEQLKRYEIPASELFQAAVRAEVERRRAIAEFEQWLAETESEPATDVPTADDVRWSEAFVKQLIDRSERRP